jgi:hypothetical protein
MCSNFHKRIIGSDKGATLGRVLSALSKWSDKWEVFVYCSRNPAEERNFSAIYEESLKIEEAVRCEYEREIKRAAAGLKMPSGFFVSGMRGVCESDLGFFFYCQIEYRGRFESLRGLVYEVMFFPLEEREKYAPSQQQPGYRYPWWLKS